MTDAALPAQASADRSSSTLTNRRALGYGIGDYGINLYWQGAGLYLFYWYTDVVGLAPAMAGFLFFAGSVWDAVTDPAVGLVAERTRTRHGRYRPYLIWASVPLAACFALLYYTPPVDGARLILDPFRGGRVVDTPDLRELPKRLAGDGAELRNDYYQIVGDRDVLLRLQNNIKTRALQQNDLARAVEIIGRMLLLAPQQYRLYRELGLIEAHAGNMQNAIVAAERYAAQAAGDAERHDAAMLLQKLRSTLN